MKKKRIEIAEPTGRFAAMDREEAKYNPVSQAESNRGIKMPGGLIALQKANVPQGNRHNPATSGTFM